MKLVAKPDGHALSLNAFSVLMRALNECNILD